MALPISPYTLQHPAPACQPAEPIFAIGDVHGHARHLEVILGHATTLLASGRVGRVAFLGDLIDRGPDSASCLRLAAEFRDRYPEQVDILAGNHESLMLCSYFHADPQERAFAAFTWNHNGGDLGRWSETKDLLTELRLGPETWKSHTLNGNVLLVHAGVCPEASDAEVQTFLSQSVLQLPDGTGTSFPHWAWIRNGFLKHHTPWPGHFVVHGHSPWDFIRKPQNGRLNLDAGSYENGRVGTAILERGKVEVSIFGFW
ncbi:MAG: metallophosphoesterase [Verrucomicrobia bacterium]|nr:metallophosphoesterase [Verrucomicrobiota bacterium]